MSIHHEHGDDDGWPSGIGGHGSRTGFDSDAAVHLLVDHAWTEADVVRSCQQVGAHPAHAAAHLLQQAFMRVMADRQSGSPGVRTRWQPTDLQPLPVTEG